MSSKKSSAPEPERPSKKAAERLAVIVDAAERAALSVIDDAEKEAQRYLDEAKARADLIAAERLRETAEEIERRSGAALPEPEDAEDDELDLTPPEDDEPDLSLAEEPERPIEPFTVLPGGPDEPPEADPALDPFRERSNGPGPARPKIAPDPPKPGSAAARLLATQMAVSGSSRKEIEMRLRSGFEIEDTGEILDAILGPEE